MTETRSQRNAWATLSQTMLMERLPFFRVVQEHVVTDTGAEIKDFYRVNLPNFAVCIPITEDGQIVTLWQYKHGPQAYSLTFPGGFIEPGEKPNMAMTRELLEETGYRAGQLIPHGAFVDGGNQPGSTGHYFTATGCVPVQDPDDGDLETIEIRLMSAEEVDTALDNGEIVIGHHLLAWLLGRRASKRDVTGGE